MKIFVQVAVLCTTYLLTSPALLFSQNYFSCDPQTVSCDFDNVEGQTPCSNACDTYYLPNASTYKGPDYTSTFFLGDINEDMKDWGSFLQDIYYRDEECLECAKEYYCQKLKNTLADSEGFQEWLAGANISLVMTTGMLLGEKGELEPRLDCLLNWAAYKYAPTAHPYFPCNLQEGNTCMDDHTVNASGLTWIYAWESLNGRVFGENVNSGEMSSESKMLINNGENELKLSLSVDESICVVPI